MTTTYDTAARIGRAQMLGADLRDSISRLTEPFLASDAALFLERLARCEAFSESERREAGVEATVAKASEILAREGALLRELAATALDLAGLVQRIQRVAEGLDDQVVDACMDLMLVAAVAGKLSPEQRREAERAVDECCAAILASPEVFEVAADFARSRASLEPLAGQAKPAHDVLALLLESPSFAADLEVAASVGDATPRAVVQAVVERWEQTHQPLTQRLREAIEAFQAWVAPGQLVLSSDDSAPREIPLAPEIPGFFLVARGNTALLQWTRGTQGVDPEVWRVTPERARLQSQIAKGGLSWVLSEELRGHRLEIVVGDRRYDLDLSHARES